MNRNRSALALVSCLVAALGLAGCGSFAGPGKGSLASTIPVKGKALFRGKPLTGGTVEFEPVNAGMLASGSILADGTFTLRSSNGAEGAVAGKHRVTVSETKEPVPRKYSRPATSGLEVEVSAEKPDVTLDLK